MKVILIILAIALSGCAGRGPFSGAVDGESMVRVQETGGSVKGGYSWLTGASVDVGGCRVESTTQPIVGLMVEYTGKQCKVVYRR